MRSNQLHLEGEDGRAHRLPLVRDPRTHHKGEQAEGGADEAAGFHVAFFPRITSPMGDKFTERARPSFMYVVIFILCFNYVGLPIFQVFGSKVAPLELPPDLLTLFGVCVSGYVFNRSAEKIARSQATRR
jgi:hypothetical protein